MKTVYLIRHAHTRDNRAHIHQHALTPLSPEGTREAEALGRRFAQVPLELVVASDTRRCQETAEALRAARDTDIPLEYSPLFREYRRASRVVGKSHFAPLSLYSTAQVLLHARNPDWRFRDAENAHEFQLRCREGWQYLAALSAKNIAVVTHRLYLAGMLAALSQHCRATTLRFTLLLLQAHHFHNAGVTKVLFDEATGEGVVAYRDDTAHLRDMRG